MKDILKKSLKAFYLMFVVNIMSFFLIISFSVISVVAFTEQIGYTAYGTMEGSEEQVKLYEYYFKDGEDTKKAEYEAKGYKISTPSLRSNPSKKEDIATKSIAGSICLIMMIAILHSEMWKFGDKDKTAVKYKGQKELMHKGFIVGGIASIPAVVLLFVFTILKSGFAKTFPLLVYGLLNTYLFDFIYIVANGATAFGDFVWWQILIIFLMFTMVPIICGISYILGYKSISIGEKFVYKNNKK